MGGLAQEDQYGRLLTYSIISIAGISHSGKDKILFVVSLKFYSSVFANTYIPTLVQSTSSQWQAMVERASKVFNQILHALMICFLTLSQTDAI